MQPISMDDIHPLSEFVRHAKDHIGIINDSGRAHVLTVNGKAEVAVLGKELFDDLMEAQEQLATYKALESSFADVQAGRVHAAGAVHAGLRAL